MIWLTRIQIYYFPSYTLVACLPLTLSFGRVGFSKWDEVKSRALLGATSLLSLLLLLLLPLLRLRLKLRFGLGLGLGQHAEDGLGRGTGLHARQQVVGPLPA